MLDTRAEIRARLGRLEFSSGRALARTAVCTALALALAFLPEHAGLGEAGRWALFILLFAAGMWMSEAIPAFAVALLAVVWFYLTRRYPCTTGTLDLSALRTERPDRPLLPLWKRLLVMAVFTLTVSLWLTGPLHGIPTTYTVSGKPPTAASGIECGALVGQPGAVRRQPGTPARPRRGTAPRRSAVHGPGRGLREGAVPAQGGPEGCGT